MKITYCSFHYHPTKVTARYVALYPDNQYHWNETAGIGPSNFHTIHDLRQGTVEAQELPDTVREWCDAKAKYGDWPRRVEWPYDKETGKW